MAKETCLTCKHCVITHEKVSRKTGLPVDDDVLSFSEGYRMEDVYTCICLPMRIRVARDYYCGQYVCDIERIQFQDEEDEETEVVNLTTAENLPEV